MEQIGIVLTGLTAIFLSSQDHREAWRRWACVFAMLGQPFWLYAAYKADQWGIFVMCFVALVGWIRIVNRRVRA